MQTNTALTQNGEITPSPAFSRKLEKDGYLVIRDLISPGIIKGINKELEFYTGPVL